MRRCAGEEMAIIVESITPKGLEVEGGGGRGARGRGWDRCRGDGAGTAETPGPGTGPRCLGWPEGDPHSTSNL
eukprot:9479676-Pyramimonas_sp.AAC.1